MFYAPIGTKEFSRSAYLVAFADEAGAFVAAVIEDPRVPGVSCLIGGVAKATRPPVSRHTAY